VDESMASRWLDQESLAESPMSLNPTSTALLLLSLFLAKKATEEAWLFGIILMSLAALRFWNTFKCNLYMISAACPCWLATLTACCLVTHLSLFSIS
jgi:hypothetical protein